MLTLHPDSDVIDDENLLVGIQKLSNSFCEKLHIDSHKYATVDLRVDWCYNDPEYVYSMDAYIKQNIDSNTCFEFSLYYTDKLEGVKEIRVCNLFSIAEEIDDIFGKQTEG